jgi:hypothetical protein
MEKPTDKIFSTQLTLDEEGKKKLLNLSEISLWLDTYDDIFSDFDPRPYSQRALSDDFLSEVKRASRDKGFGPIEINFLIPANQKNPYHEALIKKRLKDHFKHHHDDLHKEKNGIYKQGAIFMAVSVVLMLGASYLLYQQENSGFLINFLVILLEPAGWFLFWEGLYQIIFESKEINPDLHFYEKMTRAKITFMSY